MAKRKPNGHGRQPLYKSYVFKTKDPVIDELRTIIEGHYGTRVTGKQLGEIEANGGPSSSAMRSWFYGDTRRPQNPTIEAAGRALGWHRIWRRMRSNET